MINNHHVHLLFIMCCNGKCMHYISVETGSLIFAIFSVISIGLSILFIIGALVYINVLSGDTMKADSSGEQRLEYFAASLMTNVTLGTVLCVILVPFAFTIVLIKGLVEKKAGLVKVYFIHCVVIEILLLHGALISLVSGQYSVVHAILAGSVMYGLILRMIYMTYKKLEVDAQYKQTRLIEE